MRDRFLSHAAALLTLALPATVVALLIYLIKANGPLHQALFFVVFEVCLAVSGSVLIDKLCPGRFEALDKYLAGWAIAKVIIVFTHGALGLLLPISPSTSRLAIHASNSLVFIGTAYFLFQKRGCFKGFRFSLFTRLAEYRDYLLFIFTVMLFVLLKAFSDVNEMSYNASMPITFANTYYDNVDYASRAAHYLRHGFQKILWIQAFPHSVLIAHYHSTVTAPLLETISLLMPISNTLVLALGLLCLLRTLGCDKRTGFLGAIFIIFWADLGWLLHRHMDGTVFRNLLPAQVHFAPYVQSMAIAIWGIILFLKVGGNRWRPGELVVLFLTICSMPFFRPFIYYPLLAGSAVYAISMLVSRKGMHLREYLPPFFTIAAGFIFYFIQSHYRMGFGATDDMPSLRIQPGGLQEALYLAFQTPPSNSAIIVGESSVLDERPMLAILFIALIPLQFIGAMGISALGVYYEIKNRLSIARLLNPLPVDVLFWAAMAAFIASSVFRFHPSESNDIMQFVITTYFFFGVLFWSSTWQVVTGKKGWREFAYFVVAVQACWVVYHSIHFLHSFSMM